MNVVVVEDRQTLFDIALQMSGSIESVFELAMENDLSLTEDLNVQDLKEAGSVVNAQIKAHYESNKITPATAIESIIESGIEFMEIEYDFIVR